jgi:hypothetical protein
MSALCYLQNNNRTLKGTKLYTFDLNLVGNSRKHWGPKKSSDSGNYKSNESDIQFIQLALYSDKDRSISKLLMPTHNHHIMVTGTALKYTHTAAPKSAGHDNIPGCHCRRVHHCFAFGRSRFLSAVKRLVMFGFLFVFSAPPVEFLMDKTPSHSFTKCDAITSAAKKQITLGSTRVDVF